MNETCKILEGKYESKAAAVKRRWIRQNNAKKDERCNNKKNKYYKTQGKVVLSPEDEVSLVTTIKMMAYSNNALSKNEITEFVKKTYRNNYSGFDERQWLKHFLKRNGEILKQSPLKLISSARVNDISLSSVEEFLSTLKLKLETFPVTADSVVNVDEFQLKYAGYSAGRKRITAYRVDGTSHKQISSKVRGGCIGSLITFIAADGTLLYSCLCLKPDGKCRTSGEVEVYYMMSDEMDRRGANTRSRPIPQIRLYTVSGIIDNVCWDIIYSKFMNYLHDITPGKNILYS